MLISKLQAASLILEGGTLVTIPDRCEAVAQISVKSSRVSSVCRTMHPAEVKLRERRARHFY